MNMEMNNNKVVVFILKTANKMNNNNNNINLYNFGFFQYLLSLIGIMEQSLSSFVTNSLYKLLKE